jgi:predicted choloylglycine hydrolase
VVRIVGFSPVDESPPGPAWRASYERLAPGYTAWFERHRGEWPQLADCADALSAHMPELVPWWQAVVSTTGGQPDTARMLSMWCPPSIMTGCSQLALSAEATLVRNYDYDPDRFDGVLTRTVWDGRTVLGVADLMWGLLDGVNDAGLAVSLTFGGRDAIGPGFGAPLVVRYLLQTCRTTAAAAAVLARVPVYLPYTFTIVDRDARVITAWCGPDLATRFIETPAATNHQGDGSDWPEYAVATSTVRRLEVLRALVRDRADVEDTVTRFLRPPLYNVDYRRGFGTLYTAIYTTDPPALRLVWPGSEWYQPLSGPWDGGAHTVRLDEPAGQSFDDTSALTRPSLRRQGGIRS